MTAHTRLPKPLVESIRKALTRNALPGETKDFTRENEREAAEFLASVAARRRPGEVELAIESTGGEAGDGCGSGSSTTTCRSWWTPSRTQSPGAS
jgi:glutamate dehydrogenase